MLAGKSVVVTGADGFIGSHLAESLVRQGCKLRALVQYNSFNSWGWLDSSPLAKDMEIVAGDIRDAWFCQELLKDTEIVFHLAALIAIPYSYVAPDSYVATNIQGTLNLLNAARLHGVERFIHTSTSEVYGSALSVPITEDHPLQGQSPYSASKIGADQLALSFYRSFGTPVAIVRPFNTYGPRQSARAVIPTIISQALQRAGSIRLGSVSPRRDFNYIEDTVAGFCAMAEAGGVLGEVINLGTGYDLSIGTLATMIREISGVSFEIETDAQRVRPDKSEVDRLCAGVEKAKTLLNWKADYVGEEGLRRGLEQTWAWFSEPENHARYKSMAYNQ